MFSNMNTRTKGVLLVAGVYIITTVITIFILVISSMFIIDTHSCNAMGEALLTLWGIIAVVFLISFVVVGIVTWKIIPTTVGRLVTVSVHGVLLLVTYVGFAFGLLMAFNC